MCRMKTIRILTCNVGYILIQYTTHSSFLCYVFMYNIISCTLWKGFYAFRIHHGQDYTPYVVSTVLCRSYLCFYNYRAYTCILQPYVSYITNYMWINVRDVLRRLFVVVLLTYNHVVFPERSHCRGLYYNTQYTTTDILSIFTGCIAVKLFTAICIFCCA